jgi:hypothetical protein
VLGRLRALGLEQRPGEDDLSFVRRVAGVQDMIVHVPSLPGSNEPRSRLASEPPLEGEQRLRRVHRHDQQPPSRVQCVCSNTRQYRGFSHTGRVLISLNDAG